MNRIRKITSAVMAAVLTMAIAIPNASMASAETVTVEQNYFAGTTTDISKMTIGKIANQAYTGKAIKPAVTVKSGKTTLKSGTDYTLTYKNNTKIGTASVTIKGKGKYTGSKTLTFSIVPAKTKLSVKTGGSKLTFTWNAAKGAGGYQLYYSTNGGSYKKLTTTTKTTFSTTKLKLSSNSYSFKIRSYKKVGSKTYYSAWSAVVSAGKSGSSSSSISVDKLSTSGKAGTVRYLGIYDIRSDPKGKEQCLLFESEMFGGKIEYICAPSSLSLNDKLASLISSDDSPDLVTKDALRYPGNISKDYFEPLDKHIDLNSALWKDMKSVIDSYAWNGKHYYYPHTISTSYAINYNKKTIKDNNLPDPYELYKQGKWTWEAWLDIMVRFCDKSEDNIGYYAIHSTIDPFILTTGTPLIDAKPNGTISNNLQSYNVNRAMQFLEKLSREGLSYSDRFTPWVDPATFAVCSDKLLFYCMEPYWAYTAATEKIQNPQGVDNDIFNTASDFAFVPFPKDTNSDKYYLASDTFGYLIPKGSKNINGAVEFINLNRAYELDAQIQAQVKKDHIDPEPIVYSSGKYSGKQKWQITWDKDQYELWCEMRDPEKFSLVFEDCYGFNSELDDLIYEAVTGVISHNGSWTQLSDGISQSVNDEIGGYVY